MSPTEDLVRQDAPEPWHAPATEFVYRVDFPCSLLGISPPPCPLQASVLHQDGHWSLQVRVPAGRPAHVSRWIQTHVLANVHIDAGIAPTELWVRLAEPLPAIEAMLAGAVVRGVEMTPEGTMSAFIAGDEEGMRRLSELAGCQTEQIAVRPAIRSQPEPPLTPRQKEALSVAVAMGYYELPRRANLHDIADSMGMSAGAASELLRRGERTLINGFFDDRSGCLGR